MEIVSFVVVVRSCFFRYFWGLVALSSHLSMAHAGQEEVDFPSSLPSVQVTEEPPISVSTGPFTFPRLAPPPARPVSQELRVEERDGSCGSQGKISSLCRLINQERTAEGLAPMKLDRGLLRFSQGWARHMAETGDFSHGDFGARIQTAAISASLFPSENVSWGSGGRSPESVFRGWMNSPHHRENMLRPSNRRMGLGNASGSTGDYWSADFSM